MSFIMSWEGVKFNGLVPDWLDDRQYEVSCWLESCIKERDHSLAELNYSFLSSDDIQQKNVDLLEHDYATDIITLDHSEGRRRLRIDMFIGVDEISAYAEEQHLSFDHELCRVMVHGVLHCMGWDDDTIEAKHLMRKEEDKCLLSRPK